MKPTPLRRVAMKPWRRKDAEIRRTTLRETVFELDTPCIEGTPNGEGYTGRGHGRYGHREAYEKAKGPIPKGLEIDHLCRNRACMNPDHLEAVTHAENSRRAMSLITHCTNGHEFDEQNTYYTPLGHRGCRKCHADRERQRSRAHKDPVTKEARDAVYRRDQGCIGPLLGAPEPCKDAWGRPLILQGRYTPALLELDHIREHPMVGKRGDSEPRWMVLLCPWHHRLGNPPWATSNREAIREYLARVGESVW